MRTTRRGCEAGMVTVETAVVLPIVAAFALALLWMIGAAITEIRLVDAARDSARAISRGSDEAAVRAQLARTGPPGSRLDVTRDGADVIVAVSTTEVAPAWLLVPLPALSLHASASTHVEPTSQGGS